MNNKIIKIVLVSCCFLMAFAGFSQSEKEKLEQRRLELRQEIRQINSLLEKNVKEKQSVLTQVEDIDRRIKATENLIKVTNQEANLLTREINTNTNKIAELRKELEVLKEDYAKMIRKSYKSKSQQSRIMFLLSSENFLQAYKRMQYMKQYANYREQQGEEIKSQTLALQELNKKLVDQKKEKEKLLTENRETQSKLLKDKKTQEALVAQIQAKAGTFKKQLATRQQEISRIDAQIEKLIREAIAAENAKKGKSSNTSTFELTPEAKELADNFTANKGKLPWPVKSGNVSMRFGVHPHPVVRTTTIKSNGVRIETNENEAVKSIFNGQVIKIQAIKGANKAVMIAHGNYISVYNNLSSVSVQTGDKVTTGQTIGRVGHATSTGRPTVFFYILKNTQYLDPATWVYKM
ncbi:murein hydrolase activator EnvC [Mesonia sp. K7]|uniref:murein hydrolase activator EnvC family protein n=1 Tax=Mesonia sp. K7 TaxID=2218606 RepID=UPI000DAA0868|nr:peptidoglycan DD-metalloendopeptidase family protein [Mesonia sp. K7]PZD79072.1 peptidase M23 [Mesonia sp. K7]